MEKGAHGLLGRILVDNRLLLSQTFGLHLVLVALLVFLRHTIKFLPGGLIETLPHLSEFLGQLAKSQSRIGFFEWLPLSVHEEEIGGLRLLRSVRVLLLLVPRLASGVCLFIAVLFLAGAAHFLCNGLLTALICDLFLWCWHDVLDGLLKSLD